MKRDNMIEIVKVRDGLAYADHVTGSVGFVLPGKLSFKQAKAKLLRAHKSGLLSKMKEGCIALSIMCVLFPLSAFAMNQSIWDYCHTTPNPKQCVLSFLDDEERFNQNNAQREAFAQQRELARIQAQGMAMFGVGSAWINGIGQGFQSFQQRPSIAPVPMQPVYRQPLRCTTQNIGIQAYTNCY